MNDHRPVALVTGAATRLGAATASALAADGYRIALHYRSSADLAGQLAARLNDAHGDGTARLFRADLADPAGTIPLPNAVVERFGRLDLLVNNASLFAPTPGGADLAAECRRFARIHVEAPLELITAAAPHLRKATPGRVVNMVDLYADFAKPGYAPYTASKGGLKTLTRQLAVELAPDILINGIAPGAILDPVGVDDPAARERILERIPLGRFGTADDIAATVLFLARTRYVTGQVIVVDGGRSLKV